MRLMGPCFYCGQTTVRMGPGFDKPNKYTRDHIIPLTLARKFGLPTISVTCCFDCNQKKGCRLPLFAELKRAGVELTKELRKKLDEIKRLSRI